MTISDANPFFFVRKWPVFYEDNHLLILYKPSGILVQGDQTEDISLLDLGKRWLKIRYEKPGRVFLGLVHRLDRPVAGVILFCRTSKAAARLSQQIRSGRIRKQYVAVVDGRVAKPGGQLVNHLERTGPTSRIVPHPTPTSREARLTYQRLDTFQNRSLVEIDLETGRHHQIRVQLAHMGHPVIGDLRYGYGAPMPQKQIALLAKELEMTHPTRNASLTAIAPYPSGWPWPGTGNGQDAPFWNWSEIAPEVMAQIG